MVLCGWKRSRHIRYTYELTSHKLRVGNENPSSPAVRSSKRYGPFFSFLPCMQAIVSSSGLYTFFCL